MGSSSGTNGRSHGERSEVGILAGQPDKVRRLLVDIFQPAGDPVERARRARTVRFAAVGLGLLGLIRSVGFAWSGWDELLAVSELVMVASVAAFVLVRNPRHATLAAHLVVAAPFFALLSAATLVGGLGSSPLLVATAFPAIATLLISPRAGFAWLAVGGFVALGFVAWGPVPLGVAPELAVQLDLTLLFTMPVMLFLMAITWENGRRHALAAHDVATTARVEAEADVALLRSDRMSTLGQLAAGVAHEINNPLTYIRVNCEQLVRVALREEEDYMSDAELRRLAREVTDGLDRITTITGDLSALGRPPEPTQELVDLVELVEAVARVAMPQTRHKAQVEIDVAEGSPSVIGDRSRMHQVLLNLVINAALAYETGWAEENTIRIEVAPDDLGGVSIAVIDIGCGMSPEVLAKATDPFFTTREVGVGSGLGLAVCARLVSSLGGCLELESEVDEGTTARLVFPASAVGCLEPMPVKAGPVALIGCRVLVCDDDALVVRALKGVLKDMDVIAVTDGAEAVAFVERGEPIDVLLCDVMMPVLTGRDVFEALRVLGRGDEHMMVFMTGGVIDRELTEFLDNIPNPVVPKPFDYGRLMGALAEIARPDVRKVS